MGAQPVQIGLRHRSLAGEQGKHRLDAVHAQEECGVVRLEGDAFAQASPVLPHHQGFLEHAFGGQLTRSARIRAGQPRAPGGARLSLQKLLELGNGFAVAPAGQVFLRF